ncbi:MAG: glycerophosphodiester phosphodiesterase [Spirochaetia bacterium]|nr:glycerophosphodiester phosphodiesterase [Spirochaetia bacterium]MCF7954061.1 glycerophosphodiester phosphodiesterase [Spirochaetales bacterium]
MKKQLLVTILTAVLLLSSCTSLSTEKTAAAIDLENIEIIAHRGFRGMQVENTLPALTTSMQNGADAVEFDISVSADGTLYVFHDKEVDFLTDGTGLFTDLDDAYINSLRYIQAIGTPQEGIGIPRLSEVLSEMEQGTDIYPEIKNITHRDDILKIMQVVEDYGFSDTCSYQSFNFRDLAEVKKHDPHAPVSYLISASGRPSLRELKRKVDTMSMFSEVTIIFSYSNILRNPEIVPYCRDLDMEIAVYTVNDPNIVSELEELGVRKIITDGIKGI